MAKRETLLGALRRRELSGASSRHLYWNKSFVDRLWLDDELEGHSGCVNCVEWNKSGSLLASGSDDLTVKIWDPHRGLMLTDWKTGHREIIFSAKFLPDCGDHLVATGATDGQVRLHDVSRRETVDVWSCHKSRVKRLAVAADQPQLIWSGSEDGTVSQLDMRNSHRSCTDLDECPNTKINLHVAVKCIAINPVRTHLLAVGLQDRIVRVFDLRYVDDDKNEAVLYFSPGSMFSRSADPAPASVTYVSWSADGRKLLANYSGDQVYMFDVDADETVQRRDRAFSAPTLPAALQTRQALPSDGEAELAALRALDERLAKLDHRFQSAVVGECWSHARNMPHATASYDRLRRRLKERSWRGDLYAALRAARLESALEPHSSAAALHMLEAYADLRWWKQAQECLIHLKQQFPGLGEDTDYQVLAERLSKRLDNPGREAPMPCSPLGSVRDSEAHFCGHYNKLTDIKEANFLDADCRYIVAGSDDRMIYIWDVNSTRLVRAMLGDGEVVNCCQPHPEQCYLATSGIDYTIRLWSPQAMDPDTVRDGDLQVGAELEERAQRNHEYHNVRPPGGLIAIGQFILYASELEL